MQQILYTLCVIQLRPYQITLIEDTRKLMQKGCHSILITSPTGSGKTLLTAFMLKTCAERKQTAWFVVHRRELIKQSKEAFSSVGVDHGIIAAGWPSRRAPVQIASIQTLIRRHHKYAKPNLIIWDEAHHVGAKSWAALHAQYPAAYHVGLTATPSRLDGKGLGGWFKQLLQGPTVAWLIENGFLSQYRLYAPSAISVKGVHTRMGDYAANEMAALVDRPTITGSALAHYQRLANGKRAVIFCVSIPHSKHVVEEFQKAGIPSEHIDGETPTEVRDHAIERFKAGDLQVLSNVELFGEGFDVPQMECAILLRPTQSLGLHLQQIGRALRPSDSKSFAIILDHAGNTLRHGLPDDERQWSLESGTEKISTSGCGQVRVCPSCFGAQMPGSKTCKFCGAIFPLKPREVEQVEGELFEVGIRSEVQPTLDMGRDKQYLYLVQLGKRRKYKNPAAWASYVWKSRQRKRMAHAHG